MCRLRYRLRLCQDASYFSSCKSLRVIVRYLNNSCCRSWIKFLLVCPLEIEHCCLAVALLILPLPFGICFSLDRKRRNHVKWEETGKRFDSWDSDSFKLVAQIFIFTSSKVLQCKTTPTYSKACPFLVTLRIVHKWQRTKSFENVAWSELGKAKELFGMKGEYGQRQTILRIGVSF